MRFPAIERMPNPRPSFMTMVRRGPHLALLRSSLAWHIASLARCTRALDLGCGAAPYHDLLASKASIVIDYDQRPSSQGRCVAGSADLLPFPSHSFGLILCTQVLEHVPRPALVLGEAARVLEPGGIIVVSVPQMVAVHEEPHDYFRYTRYGISRLLVDAGFSLLSVDSIGGFWAMLAQQLEFHLLWRDFRRPVLRATLVALGRLVLSALASLDAAATDHAYSLNLVAVACKN